MAAPPLSFRSSFYKNVPRGNAAVSRLDDKDKPAPKANGSGMMNDFYKDQQKRLAPASRQNQRPYTGVGATGGGDMLTSFYKEQSKLQSELQQAQVSGSHALVRRRRGPKPPPSSHAATLRPVSLSSRQVYSQAPQARPSAPLLSSRSAAHAPLLVCRRRRPTLRAGSSPSLRGR